MEVYTVYSAETDQLFFGTMQHFQPDKHLLNILIVEL